MPGIRYALDNTKRATRDKEIPKTRLIGPGEKDNRTNDARPKQVGGQRQADP